MATEKAEKQLAIMRHVGYGNRDIGTPCLWFETCLSEGSAALQVLRGEKADALIAESGVYEVHELEGKPCWVSVEDHGSFVRFVGYCKL